MTHSFPSHVFSFALVALALGAWGAVLAETAPPVSVELQPQGTFYVPVADTLCESWEASLTALLAVELERLEAPFADQSLAEEALAEEASSELAGGRACLLLAEGSGREFAPVRELAADIRALLEDDGWEEDPRFAADSPRGTVMGFRQDDKLAVLRVAWEPEDEAACPTDRPCELEPEAQRYTVSLELAQEASDMDSRVVLNGDVPEAAQAAARALGQELGVDDEAVTIVEAESVEWPDACLGLAGPGEMCAQVITPGYRITLEAEGERYVYHSDARGRTLRRADGAAPGLGREERLP